MKKRTVFFISDGTGITAETLGHSLLTQFDKIQFDSVTIPYIDSLDKAEEVVQKINQSSSKNNSRPLIFSTLVNSKIKEIIQQSEGLVFDFFNQFMSELQNELKVKPTPHVGRMHGLVNYKNYMHRIEAVDFALNHDDGLRTQNYDKANLILVGVSRCGKTPTSLYLALQFGLFVANYPFIAEDMENLKLTDALKVHKQKLFGLSIDPKRLHFIREERRPDSQYASLSQCKKEVKTVEDFFESQKIPFLNTTVRSIEEIASSITTLMGLKKNQL